MKRQLVGVLLTGLVGCAFAQSTGPLAVEERASNNGNRQQQAASASEDGLVLLMQQLQQYEQELAELRSQMEEMRREIEVMRRNERERFLDLDTRINALAEARASSAPGQGNQGSQGGEQSGATTGTSQADDDAYLAARKHLAAQDFSAAEKAFQSYLKQFPNGQFRDFAHFWLGEILRVREDGRAAAMNHFRAVIDKHPDSSKVPSALYKLAVLQYEGGDTAAARTTLDRILKQYPESSDAALARSLLDQLR